MRVNFRRLISLLVLALGIINSILAKETICIRTFPRIPEIEIDQTPLRLVIEFLNRKSFELDEREADRERKGLHIRVDTTTLTRNDLEKNVSLAGVNISFQAVFDKITRQTGIAFVVFPDHILVTSIAHARKLKVQ